MTVSLLFVVDPLASLKEYKDSSIAMMREAARRGHSVWTCEVHQLAYADNGVFAQAQQLRVLPQGEPWFEEISGARKALPEFSAVLMRKDPPFDIEYLNATLLLDRAAKMGARVINNPQALRDHNEKLAIAEFPQFTVPTLVTRDVNLIKEFHREHRDIVVKPLDGMGGAGVFRLKEGDSNLNVILETLTEFGARSAMAQRYIPEIKEGDKRILVIDAKPVPFSLARVPAPGETRGNLAAGGTGRAQALSERDREIAEVIGEALVGRGLLLLGLDVIGDYLTEINVTSPTCFVEITQQTKFDVAAMFIDALQKAIAK